MSNAKPWKIAIDDDGDEIWLGGEGMGMIAVNGWVNGGCKNSPTMWQELLKEARLIAAAPDLLEALDDLVSTCELPGDHCEIEQALKRSRAAISKATKGNEDD